MKLLKLWLIGLALGTNGLDARAESLDLLCKGTYYARDKNWSFLGSDTNASTLIKMDLVSREVSLNAFIGNLSIPLNTSEDYYSSNLSLEKVIGGKYVKYFNFSLNRFSGQMLMSYGFDVDGAMEFTGICSSVKSKF